MSKDTVDFSAAIGCMAAVVIFPMGILLNGFVLCKLWMWFIVPLGVMSISLGHAYGLVLTSYLFITNGLKSPRDYDEESKSHPVQIAFKMWGHLILNPLLVWLFASVCHSFL